TGSIGRSALAVLDQHPDRFRLVAVTARRSGSELGKIGRDRQPRLAVLVEAEPAPEDRTGAVEWLSGAEGLVTAATLPEVDIVINALVGAAGLRPTIAALRAGKRVALANKESLVCGGPLVLDAARAGGGELVPIDSEHSAILQCLQGSSDSELQRPSLTASGGPVPTLGRQGP